MHYNCLGAVQDANYKISISKSSTDRHLTIIFTWWILTYDVHLKAEIRRRIAVAADAFKCYTIHNERKNMLETNKRVLKSYAYQSSYMAEKAWWFPHTYKYVFLQKEADNYMDVTSKKYRFWGKLETKKYAYTEIRKREKA